MKLGIVGSRNFNNKKLFNDVMNIIVSELNDLDLIVTGGCRGADALAEQWAKREGIPVKIFYPDWNKYGKSAGPKRNQQIIDNIDFLLAFPSRKGSGTQNSIKLAQQKGVDMVIKYID